MELQMTGTNLELTPAVSRHIELKLGKLDKHLPGLIESRVEVSEEKTKSPQQHYLIRVTVTSDIGGAVFHGEERGEDLFKAIDKVAGVMKRQLERHKGKLYDKGRGSAPVREGFPEAAAPARQVVKRKRFVLEAMAVQEAIGQMEDLGHNFFLYLDADSEEIKLLYRRDDGDYGLIEPEVR